MQSMRKFLIVIVNVVIIAAILSFVVLYSGYESEDYYRRQIEYFENTTVTMENMTENYLEGEQRICDVWAQYINSSNMTIDEAIEYIRSSHVLEKTSAHLVLLDTLTGLSTRPKVGTADEYDISYQSMDLLKSTDWIDEIGKSINIPEARVLSPEVIGLSDDALIQVRQAVYSVGRGDMTIDEAVAAYGTFTQ